MNDQNIRDFGKANSINTYVVLPDGPIDINSKEGRKLRNETIKADKLGIPIKEVYINWQNDYKKGQQKK